MKKKLIHDIRPLRAPAGMWDARTQLEQAAFRWLFLLKEKHFTLPGFNELNFMIVETSSAPSDPFVELASGNDISDSAPRLVYCQAKAIPSLQSALLTYINRCIYESLLLVCDKQPDSIEILNGVLKTVEDAADSLILSWKSIRSVKYEIELLLRPCGLYPFGGELLISTTDKIALKKQVRKLFTYYSYWDVKSLMGKLSIGGEILTCRSTHEWNRSHPHAPSEVLVSLERCVDNISDSPLFLTDISQIEKALHDHEVPW